MYSTRGGGTLIFSIYVGSDNFGGFKILNFNIFGGIQKNEYCFGYDDFVDIFWGSSQNWTKFWGNIYVLGCFLKIKLQNGKYILGLLKF